MQVQERPGVVPALLPAQFSEFDINAQPRGGVGGEDLQLDR